MAKTVNDVKNADPVALYAYDGSDWVAYETLGAESILIDSTSTANVVYICWAKVGTLTSAGSWKVLRITTTDPVRFEYADGDADYDNIADDRTTLSYS